MEKLKITPNKPAERFEPSDECNVLWNDFTHALEQYGEFDLYDIFGDNLPIWASKPDDHVLRSIWYDAEQDVIMANILTKHTHYNHYIENMRSLKFRLGSQDILIGNTVVDEIYNMMKTHA